MTRALAWESGAASIDLGEHSPVAYSHRDRDPCCFTRNFALHEGTKSEKSAI